MKLRTPARPKGFSGGAVVKNLLANAEDTCLVSELGRSPGEGNGSPCPPLHPPPAQVFLPGKSHEQRSLVSYSPWGPKRVGHHLVTKKQHIQIHGTVKHRFVCLWNFVILFGTWPDNQWHLLAGGSPVSDHCRPSKSCLPAQGPGPFFTSPATWSVAQSRWTVPSCGSGENVLHLGGCFCSWSMRHH